MGKGILGPSELMKKNKKKNFVDVTSIKWVYVEILPMLYSKRDNYIKTNFLKYFFYHVFHLLRGIIWPSPLLIRFENKTSAREEHY